TAIGPASPTREWGPGRIGERKVGSRHITVVDVERHGRAEIEAKARDRLIGELPAVAMQQGTAEGLRRHRQRGCRGNRCTYRIAQREIAYGCAVVDMRRADAGPDMGSDRPAPIP